MPSLDLMDMLPVSDVTFTPQWQQEISQQAGGTPRAADLGEELWLAKIGCSVLTIEEQRRCEAAIDALRGAIGTFYAYDPRAGYPLADRNGTILGNSAVTLYAIGADNKSVRLAGMPIGYVISPGDFFHFDAGGRRSLHKLTTGGTADGAGRSGFVSVVPHIRAGASIGISVSLKKPAAEMFMVPGTYDANSVKTIGRLSFTALQVP